MRVALHFSKLGPVRYVSHLDFQTLWQKAFVMAGIKLIMTQGFNPRPKLRFALPLATGYQSAGELVEAYLQEEMDGKELVADLNKCLPRGVKVLGLTRLPEPFPKLTSLVDGLRYRVESSHGFADADISSIVDGHEVLAADVVDGSLELVIAVREQRSVRPENMAKALIPQVDCLDVTRMKIYTLISELAPWPVGLEKLEQ